MQNKITHCLTLEELAEEPEVACHLLAVPAASTSSERSFLIAGRTIEDCTTQLNRHVQIQLMG